MKMRANRARIRFERKCNDNEFWIFPSVVNRKIFGFGRIAYSIRSERDDQPDVPVPVIPVSEVKANDDYGSEGDSNNDTISEIRKVADLNEIKIQKMMVKLGKYKGQHSQEQKVLPQEKDAEIEGMKERVESIIRQSHLADSHISASATKKDSHSHHEKENAHGHQLSNSLSSANSVIRELEDLIRQLNAPLVNIQDKRK